MAYFGCERSLATSDLEVEYEVYAKAWKDEIPQSTKNLPARKFWRDPAIKKRFPTVSCLGRRYAESPTSSVAAERAFSIMRTLETQTRGAHQVDNFRREVMFRVNHKLLGKILERAMDAYDLT